MMTPRAIFDCMIFLQAAARPSGPAAACLQLVKNKQLELWLTEETLAEARDVLSRPKTRKKFPNLTPQGAEVFLEDVEMLAVKCIPVSTETCAVRDPKDKKYLDLAIFAGAQYLVSRDNDLLDLMQDDSFRQQFPNLTILDPVAFLREFAGRQAPAGDLPPDNA